jgi:outer membrane immunogenic protein
MKSGLRIGAALVALAAFTAPSGAADIKGPAYKAPPAVFNWSGWYGGVDAGYLYGEADVLNNAVGALASPKPDGFVGGVHLGYRWQMPSKWVLGIEADFWGSSASDERPYTGVINFAPVDINWGGSVRGVVGVAMSPTLLYVTGGVAFIDVDGCTNAGLNTACIAQSQFGGTLTGWTVGFGLARALSQNWSARIEYLYADFGDKTYVTTGVAGGLTTLDLQTHTVRGGISYRFSTR